MSELQDAYRALADAVKPTEFGEPDPLVFEEGDIWPDPRTACVFDYHPLGREAAEREHAARGSPDCSSIAAFAEYIATGGAPSPMNLSDNVAAKMLIALERAYRSTAYPPRTAEQAQADIEFIYASNTPETIALLQKHYGLPPLGKK